MGLFDVFFEFSNMTKHLIHFHGFHVFNLNVFHIVIHLRVFFWKLMKIHIYLNY
jgi:hypothetical protein